MGLSWPLTGRREEVRTIEAAILASDVSGIVICGAAGVGKSRIARDALSAAVSRGCEGRWAVGTSVAKTMPLGALTAWAHSGVTDTAQLVRGVIESLTAAPGGTTVVVGVDDVHLLDDLSIFVVQQIVQRGAAKVILTVRDGDPIPAAVQEIWQGGQCDRLDLQPLSIDESSTLLSATLGGSVDPDAAQRLWTLTRPAALSAGADHHVHQRRPGASRHACKMTAAREAAGHEVLYYENTEGGHSGAANNAQAAFERAATYDVLVQTLFQ